MNLFVKYCTQRNFWIVTGFGVFVYLILRAIWVPFTHDEIGTYFHYIQKEEFLPGYAQWDANNHLLNSLLSIVMYHIFGSDAVVLRLPNVLSFVLFFYSGWKISGFLNDKQLRSLLMIALVFSHGFTEFFALGRGYGMSMAFLLLQLWMLMEFMNGSRLRYILIFSGAGFLSVYANLTLLPLTLIQVFLFALILFFRKDKTLLVKGLILILSFVVLILPAVIFGFALNERGALYYGGDSFYNLTVQRLEFMMWGGYTWWTDALLIFSFLLIVFSFIFLILKKKTPVLPLLIPVVFFLSLLAVFAQHYVMGINYPEDRTGMYLYPLLALSFFLMLDRIPLRYFRFVSLMVLLLPVHFIMVMNVSGVTVWRYQGMPERFYSFVRSDFKGDRPFLASSQKLLGFAWTWHDHTYDPPLGPVQHYKHTDGLADYVISTPEFAHEIDFSKYHKVDEDEWTGLFLLKKKKPVTLTLITDTSHSENVRVAGDEFYGLKLIPVREMTGKTLAVQVSGMITTFDPLFYGMITWSGETSDDPGYYYEQYHMDWYRRYIHRFNVTYMMKNIPDGMDVIKIYIFNTRAQEYTVNRMNIKIYEVALD